MRFRLREFSLSLSAPYAVGDLITAAEANALNEFRLRKIRAKLEAALQKMERQEGGIDEATLRVLLKELDEGYRFDDKLVSFSSGRPAQGIEPLRGTIEWDVWGLAKEELERQLAQAKDEDGEPFVPTLEEQEKLLLQLMGLPWIQEAARKRYRAREKMQKDVLLDLLGGLTKGAAE